MSEFRIESGLNCGGHAFATDGVLMGPILEEFKTKKEELKNSLFELYHKFNTENNRNVFFGCPDLKITAQGGIGTFEEDQLLKNYYEIEKIIIDLAKELTKNMAELDVYLFYIDSGRICEK